MPDYDIVQAFHEIESELIRSMMGNFKRHRAEETAQGYNWTQWQAEQLKYLNEYIRGNQEIFPKRFDDINEQIDQMLATAATSGEADQEVAILKAIRQGYTPPHTPSQGLSGGFFSLNGRKLDALRKATQSDFSRAEYAVLRKANDAYRKIIFNAQVYANIGAGTYEKAVDMAARDFLRAGINSIVYKNGSTHTIEDYADMAIRTASKRAYLMGEGNRRAEWGIRKVVVNSRIGACPRCGQYVGKVFIDDVYSGGSKADGDEPLLSEAIRGGLFHPRCKDSTSTYFEGITTLKPMTEEEMEEMDRRENKETRRSYHEREAEKNQRIADNSLDPDNKKAYAHRAEEHRKKAVQIAEKPVANSGESGIIKINNYRSVTECKNISEARQYFREKWNVEIDRTVDELDFESVRESLHGIESVLNGFPSAVDSLKRIGTSTEYGIMNADYDGNINFNPFYFKERKKAVYGCNSETHYHPTGNNIMSTGAHETGHILEKALIDKRLGGEQPIGNVFWNTGDEAKKIVKQACKNVKKTPHGKKKRNIDLIREISGYANKGGNSECLAEAVADFILNGDKAAPLSREIWKLLKGELV